VYPTLRLKTFQIEPILKRPVLGSQIEVGLDQSVTVGPDV
jgi:hypothetical protein